MDYDYGINPAFSNDESVEYPPSLENQRRSNQYSEAGNARYYSDAEIINDLQMDEDDDENEIFEHTLSEHEYNTDAPYADEYDSAEDPYYIDTTSESQMSKSQGKMKRRQPFTRKTLLGMLALVLFVVVVALGIATASKKNNGNQQSAVSESNSAIVNPTSKSPTPPTPPPAKSPVVAPTKDPSTQPTSSAPYDHKYPTQYPPSPTPYHPSSNGHYPTPDYDMHPTPDEYMHPTPTTTDHSYPYYSEEDIMCNRDEIHVDKQCYTFGESIEITYKLCNPGEYNWFGIFNAQGARDRYGRMRKKPLYWELPCGGQGQSCPDATPGSRTITMNANIAGGRYQVYSISHMKRPYQSTSSSQKFIVARHCPSFY